MCVREREKERESSSLEDGRVKIKQLHNYSIFVVLALKD